MLLRTSKRIKIKLQRKSHRCIFSTRSLLILNFILKIFSYSSILPNSFSSKNTPRLVFKLQISLRNQLLLIFLNFSHLFTQLNKFFRCIKQRHFLSHIDFALHGFTIYSRPWSNRIILHISAKFRIKFHLFPYNICTLILVHYFNKLICTTHTHT